MTPTATTDPQQEQATTRGRIFRGRRLEDVLEQARTELGPDALVLRQREGLVGGIGGFFAQRFYEIEAVAGGPSIDTYDDEDALPAEPDWDAEPSVFMPDRVLAELEESEHRADAEPVSTGRSAAPPSDAAGWAERELADSFADRLARAAASMPEAARVPAESAASPSLDEPRAPTVRRESMRVRRRTRRQEQRRAAAEAPAAAERSPVADTLTAELVGRGFDPGTAAALVAGALAHIVPFHPQGGLRDAVRASIARTLNAAPPPSAAGAAIAFVGPGGAGKTCCTAGLAASYSGASTLQARVFAAEPRGGGSELEAILEARRIPVIEAEGDQLARRVATARGGALVVIDTPAVSPADPAGIAALAAELGPLALDQTIVTVPATLSLAAARQLLRSLSALNPTAIAVTHTDETDQLGVAASVACETGLPIAYVHSGIELPGALTPADPAGLAEQLLP